MKIHQIISEDRDLDEAPVGKIARAGQAIGRYFGSAAASGAEDVSDEANNLKKQLSKWMGGASIAPKTLTIDQLEQFLQKAGYGGMAAKELQALRANRKPSLGQRAKAGIKAAGAAAGTAAGKVGQTIKNVSGVVPHSQINQGMYEQADQPLTNKEVDKVLLSVVRQSYAKAGKDIKVGKYANQGTEKPKLPADVVSIISKLPKDQQQKLIAAFTKRAG